MIKKHLIHIIIYMCNNHSVIPTYIAIALHVLFFAAMAITAFLVYNRAVDSRKYYKCPGCGESFRAEFMNAKCCKVCGTFLERTDDEDVSDKTF